MKTKFKKGRMAGALLFGLVVTLALFVGLLIGAELYVLIVPIIVMLVLLPVLYLMVAGIEDRSGWLLACGAAVMLLSHTFQSKGLPIGYALELAAFTLMLSSSRKFWTLSRDDTAMRAVFWLFSLYLACGIISTLLGRSHKIAAIWQLQYNFKLPLMFILGTLVVYNEQVDAVWRRILIGGLLFIFPIIVLEGAAHSVFVTIFGAAEDFHVNPLLHFGGRFRGPFSHAGYMAVICGVMCLSSALQWQERCETRWLFVAAGYLVLVLLSGQRGEATAVAVTGVVLFLVSSRKKNFPVLMLAGFLMLGALGFSLLYSDKSPFTDLLVQWGGGRASELSERAILTEAGMKIADQYFPFGSGLGTYGGAGAQKFDLSQFVELGFNRYWWFRSGLFSVDTYWPHVMAENGYPGAIILFSMYVLLSCLLLLRAVRSGGLPRIALLTGWSALVVQLLNSPTSAMIGDPRGGFIFWVMLGCGWRAMTSAEVPIVQSAQQMSSPFPPSTFPITVSHT